jgi:hypothetical protein
MGLMGIPEPAISAASVRRRNARQREPGAASRCREPGAASRYYSHSIVLGGLLEIS